MVCIIIALESYTYKSDSKLDDFKLVEDQHSPVSDIVELIRRDKDATNIVTVKLSDMLKKSKLTHSARSVWQVEAEHVQIGSLINWNTSCRLKHIASGQYLCVKRKPRHSHHDDEEDDGDGMLLTSLRDDSLSSNKYGPQWYPLMDGESTDMLYCVCTTHKYTDTDTLFRFCPVTLNKDSPMFVTYQV